MIMFIQLPRKKISHGREARQRRRAGRLPFDPGKIGPRPIEVIPQGRLELPDRRIFTMGYDSRVFFFYPLHRQFHIGLPRTNPYLADHDILQPDMIDAIDIHDIRAACLLWRQHHPPFPTIVRLPGDRLPIEFDRDLLSRRSPSPDPDSDLPLQHHDVADQTGYFYLPDSRRTNKPEKHTRKHTFLA